MQATQQVWAYKHDKPTPLSQVANPSISYGPKPCFAFTYGTSVVSPPPPLSQVTDPSTHGTLILLVYFHSIWITRG